jgi:hypothetical protein
MANLLLSAESVLHGEFENHQSRSSGNVRLHLLLIVAFCGAIYGACMGASNGIENGRGMQILYSAIKVPLLLVVTFAISLPSFFIFNTLSGMRADFNSVFRALAAGQAGLTILLAALSPIVLLWNASTADHQVTVLLNGLLFGVATVGGQVLLRRYYRPLIARDRRHRLLLMLWGCVYSFVGVQMGWVLRPFVGEPNKPVRFFREDAWGNAYVMVANLVQHVIRR